MTRVMCRCGHGRGHHIAIGDSASPCIADRCMNACLAFNPDKVLPDAGERLTFGVHRQAYQDAETAPAWAFCGHLVEVFGCPWCIRRVSA